MGDYIVNVALDMMEQAEDGVMMLGVLCVPITKKKPCLVMGALCICLLCAGSDWYQYDGSYIDTFRILLSMAAWMFLTEGRLYRKFAVYICSLMYLGLPYSCVNWLLSVILGKSAEITLGQNAWYQLARGLVTILLMGCAAVFLRRKVAGYREIVRSLPTRYFLIGSVCAFSSSMVHHFVNEISYEFVNVELANAASFMAIIVSTMFYAFGVGIVVLDIFRKRYKEESRLKEQYLEIAKNYVKTVRDNAKETRKMRHDMQNHMNILHHHLKHSEYDKAYTYLSEMKQHMEQAISKTVSVNHEIVDAVLFQMQTDAKGRHIRWEVEGLLPKDLPIGDFDLCTIFSNLLSNSIEACMEVEEKDRYIHLEIRSLDKNLVIEMENPSAHSVDTEKLGEITSKSDKENHGYGILNIKDAVHKNHGEIRFESTEVKFMVQIVFRFAEK